MLLVVIQQPLRHLLPQHLHLVLRLGALVLPVQQADQLPLLHHRRRTGPTGPGGFLRHGFLDDAVHGQDLVVPGPEREVALRLLVFGHAVGFAAALLAGGWGRGVVEGFGGGALAFLSTRFGGFGGGFRDAADLLVVGFEDVFGAVAVTTASLAGRSSRAD